MSRPDRGPGLVLAILLGGVARNWRKPWSRSAEIADLSLYCDLARKAEAAKIHSIFLADALPASGTPEPSFEPVTLLSALAPLTERIGLIASISTTFTEPYNLARQVASLDRLSAGRAGWNLVTSAWGGEHFGKELPAHDERYAIADEFAGAVKALWDTWAPDAIIADPERNLFVDPARVRTADWVSEHFSVRGPLNVPPSSQGRPIIAQAGSSEAGTVIGGRHADVVFTTGQTELEPSRLVYANIKRHAAAAGRAPDDVKILPGVAPVIGSTEAEARRVWAESHELLDYAKARASLATQFAGVDFSGYDLDAPVPLRLLPDDSAVQGRRSRYGVVKRLVETGQLKTVRDVILYHASAAGHWFPIGSVEQVADQLQDRYCGGAADGFCLLPFFLNYPAGLEALTEGLIPELRRRGLFHTDYEHDTLRGNLGLAPYAPSATSKATSNGKETS
jgi:FMN-dependent oxidoreductase (nitrilotriacetate monooxygenase family)